MRTFAVFLLMCSMAHADVPTTANPYAPQAFESEWAMQQWANSTWGGARTTELTYNGRKLVVYFRAYTSGLPTSEPVVFVEKEGRWIQVLSAMMCRSEMAATIEGDALVLWRLEGTKEKTEYARFNLTNLDAA